VASAAPFDSDWLSPYLADGDGAAARRLLLAGHPARAAAKLQRHLKQKKPADVVQARFLLAHALMRQGKVSAALKLFQSLRKDYPLLAAYHRVNAAEALFKLKRYKAAAALAAGVGQDAVPHRRARWLRARALSRLGHHRACAEHLRAHLGAVRAGSARESASRHLEARLLLARSLEAMASAARSKRQRTRLRKEALGQLKRVVIAGVLSAHGETAKKRLARLSRRLRGGAGLARLTPDEQFAQARVLSRAMRNKLAEAAYGKLLRRKRLARELRCKASYYQARAVFQQRDRARAEPLYVKAIKRCRAAGLDDLVVKSLYNGARGLVRKGKFKAAVARYAVIEKKHARHSYADDARLRAAEAHVEMKDPDGAARLLATIPDRYPAGDMKREALWRLARQAYFGGKLDQALKHLNRIIDTMGRARIYYAHGRALYWKARILARQKKAKAARELYVRCIRDYPLSYYALLSFNRLREAHNETFTALRQVLLSPAGRPAGPWSFKARPLFGSPGFLRGVELARLGFGRAAGRELSAAGVAVKRGQDSADLWLAAVLYDSAGLWHLSHMVPRTMDRAYRWSYPQGEGLRRWTLSFPRAFLPEVKENATGVGIPPWLVLAVMREESGFSTTVESWANAVGLMQLILPTARTTALQHKIKVSRKALHDPAVNVKLGATYLGFLFEAFGQTFPLAISGYNAGEGATMRWLKRFKGLKLDEMMERIPYDQTRRYTKRVLSSLFTYALLYGAADEQVPVIPLDLPTNSAQTFKDARDKLRAASKGSKKK